MKRLLTALLLALVILSALGISVLAIDPIPTVGEKEFSVASFHGTKNFLTDVSNPEAIEDSCYWLIDNNENFKIKYVSFLGQIAGGANYTYYNYSKKSDELRTANATDEDWLKEFDALNGSIDILKESGIPSGVSYSLYDTYANGFLRDTNQSAVFPVIEIMPDDVDYDFYNDANYYTIVENNKQKYIVFQLELWPQQAVLDWFNTTIGQHQDKYAIVFTSSMIDEKGDMYTMFDWEETGGKIKLGGSSKITSHNICDNKSRPRDGDQLWNYAFSKHDNILAIITSYVTTEDVVLSKQVNPNGIEVATIAANMIGNLSTRYGAMALITSFSEDHKTVTCNYTVPFEGTLVTKSINLNKIGTLAEPTTNDSLPQVAVQYNGANKAYIFGYEGNTFRPNANMTRAEACTIFARLILNTQTIPDGYTTRFTDVKNGDWFYNAVAYLDETGFFFRNKNTTYKPNEPITRAEFVDLANSASALKKSNKEIAFKDVAEDHFYHDSIIAAAGAGLVNGYEDETFRPDNTITRAEVVTVINRLLGLKATAKTISEKHLDNEFVDVKGHWARLNILMASNSNVHGDYYYEKTLENVKETATAYTFENKHIAITVNKNGGKVSKIINKYTDEDINLASSSYQFIYLTAPSGAKVVPSKLETEGNRIKVTFKNGAVVYMLVEINDNFMTFEIDSELVAGGECIVFANLETSIKISDDDESFRINAVGMSAWTNPVNKGYGRYTTTTAKVYPKYDAGTMGAKLGIAFGKKCDILDYLKEIMQAIDPSVGITGTTGGAYAQDYTPNAGDYVIVSTINEENVPKIVEACTEYGIDQVDIHKGNNTHRPGDFYFYNTETGTAKEYYEKYGKQFEKAGILTGLHTYAYYIDYKAENILAEPKWQKDLETLEEYTLRKDVTKFKINLPTVEDATKFDLSYAFFNKNSRYVLIDEEIILITKGTSSGFINVKRGQCGTSPQDHKAGAKIKHLSGYFQLFTPVLGSELFYHVADLTAKAYNEGGFSMIYLDAIDGLNRHTPEGHEVWYYFQIFVQRIVSQCKVSPIVETSSGSPQEWNVRGRAGAYDYPTRGYNTFNAGHITNNRSNMNYNMNTTLGWYNFYPDSGSTYKNTTARTHFKNNFDYMGYQAVVYNMSIVLNGFNPTSIENNPYLQENLNYYKKYYSDLRKSNYFTDEVIEKVKASSSEFKIIEKSAGEFAFLEMYYNYGKIGTVVGLDTSFSITNPFVAQSPFIRIEQMYSTLGENPLSLATFDETKALSEQSLKKTVSSVDISNSPTLKMRVQGTGKSGDAMLISLSGSDSGRADYFVDLSFDGWRDVIVAELDNGAYDTAKYKFSGITLSGGNYASFVSGISFSSVKLLEIRLSGATAGNAHIGEIAACTPVDASVKNPKITVGSESVTFNTTLKAGEYIEYDPLTGKAIIYHANEQTKEEVSISGGLKNVAKGSSVATYSAQSLTEAPVRASIVFGFSGEEITN